MVRVRRNVCWPPDRILVCSGGLPYSIRVEKLAIRIAKAAGGELTILHVVEPVTLDYSLAQEVHTHWSTLLKTDTPQARHLQQVLQLAIESGVQARVLVHHGPIVEEIRKEMAANDYSLVAMGSVYSSHSLHSLYRPDVTALISASVDCPLLTARGGLTDTF